ncbi:recombinase family protein [Bradyrhizobium nanningense]|uniref:recombinase family protein n=1 Tax=Bradyrhizobium nanningense TaxID=1325118 RepID=UPI001008E1B4|nr:recombinase family protein [Bradyrhizobium nanningense]
MKNLSRAEAADFSRRLSKRVFIAASYGVSLGFWQRSSAGYGLRRSTVDEYGNRRVDLGPGEQKHYKTDRVILVPGPQSELDVVRRIFTEFATRKKTRTEIANDLNREGIFNSQGRPWQMQTVNILLKNEKYLGQIVYNRRSYKLQKPPIDNPHEMWIRHENAFTPLVSPELFAKAQKVLSEVECGRRRSDEELLSQLKALWRRKGHLSRDIIQADKKMFSCTAYARRFGSIMNAYDRIGFDPGPRFHFYGTGEKANAVIQSTANELIAELQRWGEKATFLPELNLLTIDGALTVVIATAWSVADGTLDGRRHRRWHVRKLKFPRADQALIIRMQEANASIMDYFLLGTKNLPFTKDRKLRVSELKFADYRHGRLSSVLRAIYDRLRQSRDIQSSR